MATKMPLIINDVRFWINPTNLAVKKALSIAQLDTMVGRQFQIWWPAPEVLTITGETFGENAYKQLVILKKQYEGTSGSPKVSTLTYKTYKYSGYITGLDVSADVRNLGVWTYTLNFQFLAGEKFRVEDFSITTTGPTVQAIGQIEKVGEVLNLAINNITETIQKAKI